VEPTPAPAPETQTPPEKPAVPAAIGGYPTPDFSAVFKPTETSVPLEIKPDLDKVAARVKENASLRISLVAYAAVTGDQSITARRVSLSRALAVRAYLIDQGIASLRINVQAEGDKNPGGEPDRVDVFVKSE
jgi:outer membrane protein OmpA-like peptidoglycan-associated protein